jgi:hypothetical protein
MCRSFSILLTVWYVGSKKIFCGQKWCQSRTDGEGRPPRCTAATLAQLAAVIAQMCVSAGFVVMMSEQKRVWRQLHKTLVKESSKRREEIRKGRK